MRRRRVPGLRFSCPNLCNGVLKRTVQANLWHIKSFTMWRLVLAGVMLTLWQGG
jgi:hypothetical protein